MFMHPAFILADPKSAKKTDNLTVFFAPLGSAHLKAARRTLMKFTLDGVQSNVIVEMKYNLAI
jgi:hypothetical protein